MRPARLRLRRRLLWVLTPVAVLAVLVAVKLASLVLAGDAAISAYDRGDADALRRAVGVLGVADVVAPARTDLAEGALAVLDGRLADADAAFTDALAHTAVGESCAVRVNLELVREALGDLAARDGDVPAAERRYTGALTVVGEAPPTCFAGNTDPDPQRRAVRAGAAARLAAKLEALRSPQAARAAPPAVPVAPPPPPPPPPAGGAGEPDPAQPRELGPGAPLDRLRQLLQDAAGQAG
jgi:hypothetical protein